MEFLALSLVFALLSAATFAGFSLVARRVRGEPKPTTDDDDEAPPRLLLGELTPALAAQLPVAEEERADLHKELRRAGYYRPTAVTEYIALRTALIIMPLIGAGVISLFVDETSDVLWVWGGGIIAAILGFSLPRLVLNYMGQQRSRQIERGLPTAIDMLILCLGAGQNVLNSVARVAKEVRPAYPVVADELEIVHRQAELKTLEFALGQFAERVDLAHLRNLAIILAQSEQLGTDAVSILREYAEHLRITQRHRAEELANKAPFRLIFPAYVMAIGAAILIISPAALELAAFRRSNVLGSSREGLQGLESPTIVPNTTPAAGTGTPQQPPNVP